MDTLSLTKNELIEITGKERPSAQIKWLRSQGFTVVPRADGLPLVSRNHFEAMMGGEHYQSKALIHEPDFSSL